MHNEAYTSLTWDDYIGQEKLKDRIQIHAKAAVEQGHQMDHVLLSGVAGSGKTSMARLIAEELGTDIFEVTAPLKKNMLKRIVGGFQGVFFIDEIHRMPAKEQEELLTVLQEGYFDDGGEKIEAGWLCIVGATTEQDQLIEPLFSRFPIRPKFEDHSDEEMGKIVKGMADRVGIEMSQETADILGLATGGVPRNAKMMVNMARDLGSDDVDTILEKLQLTREGFTEDHVEYVLTLARSGGTAGLNILKAHLRLTNATIVGLERLLVKRKMIEYTKSGRSLMGLAYNKFDIPFD